MRIGISTMKFSGNLTDLKKFLEEKVRDEELKKLLEEKDKEDEEFMKLHQGDNMTFSG